MRASTIFTLLAGSAVVSASVPAPEYPEGGEVDSTTTLTATTTTTRTITLTSCGPDVPDCPAQVSTPAPEPTTEAVVEEPTTEAVVEEPTTEAVVEEPTPTEVEEEEEVVVTSSVEDVVSTILPAPPSSANATATRFPGPNTIITQTSFIEAQPTPTGDESPGTEGPDAEEPPILAGAASAPVQAGLLFGAALLAFLALN